MPDRSPTPQHSEPTLKEPLREDVGADIHLLVVDDNDEIRIALQTYFEELGYEVTAAADGISAMEQIERHRDALDLILLDVMLPEKNGFEVLEETQEMGLTAPVLMMSGRGSQEDVLRGFGLGAQDYIVKPFNADELVARVRAILGRTMAPADAPMRTMRVGDLEINFSTFEAYRRDERLDLSELEFDLLRYLVQHRGQVVSRKRLLQEAWSIDQDLIMHQIDPDIVAAKLEENIAAIRQKIETDPARPRLIEAVYGLGYRFNAAD